jgi:hypothetical protein
MVDDHPFNHQGPLAELDQVPVEIATFLATSQEI